MNVFLRTFNNKINSKTGYQLPEGQYRGTPEWMKFQDLLISCLHELGHKTIEQPESPIVDDFFPGYEEDFDRRIYVHKTRRDVCGHLYWMQMHMKELFTIDTDGWGADASNNNFKLGDVDSEEAKAFCEEKSAYLLKTGESKCEQASKTCNTPEDFILVPLQIPRDYTIQNHSPITIKYFIDSLISWANEQQIHIGIKMHPHNRADYELQLAVDSGLSEYVHKVEGNIHELIKRSMGVFVINSGTGFESLIHGKPVATFGNCDYNKATFNADLRRLNEAFRFLQEHGELERAIAYQFIYWYWKHHAYNVNTSDTKERLLQYLKENL